MLTKTLSEAKKKQRNILIKAMNNDIGSIDSSRDSWNPAQISERAKDISYIRSLVDTWNPAQLNEALRMLDLPVIDTWNPAQIEEQRRNLVFYLAERTLTGNPITLNILGNLTTEVTGLKVTMNPIQDLHGYSNPWAGGAGKNKLANLKDGTYEGNGIKAVVKDGVATFSGTSTASGNAIIIPLDEAVTVPNQTCYLHSMNSVQNGSVQPSIEKNGDAPNTAIAFALTPVNRITEIPQNRYGVIVDQVRFYLASGVTLSGTFSPMICLTNTETDFAPYENICPISGRTEVSVTRTACEDVETKTHQYGQTVYGGEDDFVNGGLTNEWGYIASYDGETLPDEWISDRDVYAPDTTPTTGAEVAFKLATPATVETTPEEITLLKGNNVLSTDGDSIELKYKQNF